MAMGPLNFRKVTPLPLTPEHFAQTVIRRADFGKPKLLERRNCDWMELRKARLENW